MLTQQIKTDMTTAMKARDMLKVNTLRGAMTAFTNELVAKGRKPTEELADPEAVTVLKRLAKQRQDSIEQFTKGNRPELAEKESKELEVLKAYLPQTASREEIEKVALAKKAELGVTDAAGAGKLMGAVIKEFAGRADGGDVKAVIQGLFS
ncbi:MAG: GatB/YqeY domain-containing protein [Patescibacteria group bacterium]